MKHYINKQSGQRFAFEEDGSQDFLITSDLTPETIKPPTAFHAPIIEDGVHVGWGVDEQKQRAALIPESVTKRQARQELLLSGMLDAIQPAIDGIADPIQRQLIQIYWDESAEYELNHPELQAMAQAIGLTQTQLEDMFISASQR